MPDLAKTLLVHANMAPQAQRDGEYYGYKFALQSIAGQYQKSLQSIDSMRVEIAKIGGIPTDQTKGIFFLYDTYNHIKIMNQEGDSRSAAEIFKWSFPISLENFKGMTYNYAIEPFSNSQESLDAAWQKALAVVQAKPSDSVSLDQAIVFSQAYLQQQVYRPFLNPGKEMINAKDHSRLIIQDSVMITMRDGVKLAAVIVRSRAAQESQPVVLVGNIYASTDQVAMARRIADKGYVGMVLNTRGKYVSEAEIAPWEHDAEDTYDAIDWISKQEWCNGKVGMIGGSYLGFSQWAATKKLHPALKTIVPQAAAAPGIDFPTTNGILTTYSLRWAHLVTNNKLSDWDEFGNTDLWTSLNNKWFLSGKAFKNLDSLEGRPNSVFQKWAKHPSYDQYWQKMIPYQKEFAAINIPVLTITGYFDSDQDGALYYFKQHHQWNSAPNHYLLIGPYDHGGAQGVMSPTLYGYNLDSVAKININQLAFQWFDYVLKDGLKPALLKDKVNYQTMDTSLWGHAPSLEKMNDDVLQFYFSEEKKGKYYQLTTKKTTGKLAQEMDFSSREISTKVPDYNLLTDTIDTKGSLIFISEALKEEVTLNGQFSATLQVVINKRDLDIVVGLYEQQADGKFFRLSASLHRASYAKDRSKRNLLKPGKLESIPITGKFISKRLHKGSKLMLSLELIKNPNFQVNYGTDKAVSDESILDAISPLKVQWLGSSAIQIPIKR
ncbi:CocE/NonD family hydrolase [Pedobacter gandavensis]|uniref:CocE/NonD family hydrolase n=1 Tax=Pedobacter gandavensis TaxID=2679963 RepID=UPI00292E721B|nr:CocE/NonD family hydrolase [Pedobacter gandavensis]